MNLTAVVVSMHTKWIIEEAAGRKTWELRKTKPRLQPPFKVYINAVEQLKLPSGAIICRVHPPSPVIVGEFDVDRIERFAFAGTYSENAKYLRALPNGIYADDIPFEKIGLSREQLDAYGNKSSVYAWHIKHFKLYDTPKSPDELFEYCATCPLDKYRTLREPIFCKTCPNEKTGGLKRSPQSWCYVRIKETNNTDTEMEVSKGDVIPNGISRTPILTIPRKCGKFVPLTPEECNTEE